MNELGDGTNTASTVPVGVSGGLTFQSLSAAPFHNCGLTTAGAAYCWGQNNWSQLGNGTNTDSGVPVVVTGGLTFRSVSAGNTHSCGVTTVGAA
ncbi:MAG: RCC1 domain-containing protein [Acidimicrobiia bacterium]|jgi:alpha-tubulin suppressor-like RCC1 family protein